MEKIVVNVQTYGDFDIPCTAAVMIAPEWMTKAQVKSMLKHYPELNCKTNDPKAVIKELELLNFTLCTTVDLTVGGEL